MTDGLKDNHRNEIIDVLSANKRIERVVLFGSRAMGTYTMTSDVDLVLYGDHLTLTDQAHLTDALDKLTVPQRVDLVLHNVIDNDELCKHIERHGIEWYRRQRNMGLTDAIDISVGDHKLVLDLLKQHLPNVAVWAYGSRVKWTARPQSDLDLVAFASCEQKAAVLNLREALEESNLPFPVDLFIWDELPESIRRWIKAEYVVLVEKEELGMVGDGWGSLRLGDVCTKIGSGATPRGGQEVYLKDGPYALIRSQNVHNNRFNYDGLAFINQQQATALDNVGVFADDVLLNITGDSVARVCQVAPDVLPARVNQHVVIIRPDPNKLSPRFLRYFLLCPEIQAMLLSWAGSGGTRNALTKRMIESLDVQAPMDMAKQRAISHILGTLDDKIELNRRMNETLEEMARALFKSWFVDFDPVRAKMEGRDTGLPPDVAALFPDRLVDSELGEIPEGWEVKALGKCIDVARGLSYKGTGLSLNGMPMHNLNSIYEGGGYKDDGIKYYNGDYHLRHAIQPGEVIVANTEQGHDRLLIGFAAIVPKRFGDNGLFSHHIYRVRPNDSFSLPPDFICQLLNTKAMHNTVSGYATGTTVNMLPVDALRIPSIVVPPLQVVTTFSTFAKVVRIRQEKLMAESRTLTALRDALLPKLVSGELRVRENVQKGSI